MTIIKIHEAKRGNIIRIHPDGIDERLTEAPKSGRHTGMPCWVLRTSAGKGCEYEHYLGMDNELTRVDG